MPVFRYQAQTKDGRMISSNIEALSLNLAIDTLTANKLKILEITPVRFSLAGFMQSFGKIDQYALVVITRRMGAMLKAGLPMARVLQVLYEQETDKKLKPIMMTVLHDIRTGSTLSWSLAKHPNVFSAIYISMIKVGETTGDLALMLDKLADFLEREYKISKQAGSAMTYPIFVFATCILVVGFIFTAILPGLLDAFVGLAGPHNQLPLPTIVVMWMVNSIKNTTVELGFALGVIYYTIYFRAYVKTPEGKYKYDRLKLRAPVIGDLNRKLVMANFCRALGILLATGVPLLKSLEVLMEFMDNEYFRRMSVQPLYEGVREGKDISVAIQEIKMFPTMVVNMVAVGEKTGELPQMLTKVSAFYDQEVVYALEGFLQMIEPIMISVMGVIVCFVLLAVFMPLYQVIMQMSE